MILPAHFAARSVDVIAEPVYFWRIREGGDLSITQRRVERQALLDRLAAVEYVSDHLAERRAATGAGAGTTQSVVADDLSYYLNALESADDEYRALFLDRVNEFLDRARAARVFDGLPAIDRLKWHLVRRRLMPELLEVLRFQREDLSETRRRCASAGTSTPTIRSGPTRAEDPAVAVPRRSRAAALRADRAPALGGLPAARRRLGGGRGGRRARARHAEGDADGAAARPARAGARARGRRPCRARGVHRPDLAGTRGLGLTDTGWAGFTATLPVRRLRGTVRRGDRDWDLYVTVKVGRVPQAADALPARRCRAAARRRPDARRRCRGTRAGPVPTGEVRVSVRDEWARVTGQRLDGGTLEIAGELRAAGGGERRLELRQREGSVVRRYPVTVDEARTPATFRAAVPLDDLLAEGGPPVADPGAGIPDGLAWDMSLAGSGRRLPRRGSPPTRPRARSRTTARRSRSSATSRATPALVARTPRATATAARWTDDGDLDAGGRRSGCRTRASWSCWRRARSSATRSRSPTAPGPLRAPGRRRPGSARSPASCRSPRARGTCTSAATASRSR